MRGVLSRGVVWRGLLLRNNPSLQQTIKTEQQEVEYSRGVYCQ